MRVCITRACGFAMEFRGILGSRECRWQREAFREWEGEVGVLAMIEVGGNAPDACVEL